MRINQQEPDSDTTDVDHALDELAPASGWGDGGYHTTPEAVMRTIFVTAIGVGRVPLNQYISIESEGYSAHFSWRVSVSDPDEFERSLTEAFADDDRITVEFYSRDNAAELVESLREPLASMGVAHPDELLDRAVEGTIPSPDNDDLAEILGDMTDEEFRERAEQTVVGTVETVRYQQAVEHAKTVCGDEWEDYEGLAGEWTFADDIEDVPPEARTEVDVTVFDRFSEVVRKLTPNAVAEDLVIVNGSINVEAASPYYG